MSPKPPYRSLRPEIQTLVRSPSAYLPAHLPLQTIVDFLEEELTRYDTSRGPGIEAYCVLMQEYKVDCQSLLVPVPIRHLPTEILVQIFEIHSAAFMQPPPYEFEIELKRLAHARLLTVSQACARWHDIVIDTPPFWTMFELNSILWSTSSGVAKTTHCWKRLWNVGKYFYNIAVDGRGNLPLIKLLQLNARDMPSSAAAQSVEFFRSAPQLDSLLVPQRDLIEVLSQLQSLEFLQIADHQKTNGDGVDFIVTDSFLCVMTFQTPADKPTSRARHLVPRVRRLGCASQLAFTESVFVNLVTSRVEVRVLDDPIYVAVVRLAAGDEALHRAAPVHAAMEGLVANSKRRLA
ncbi:hypothetical protein B0H14DRAFT_3434718 [Mycena olivaceomarginata]|nr:hypothetical protein B0H14DRAFT_3434718 [Mycena olivaceomarginata]